MRSNGFTALRASAAKVLTADAAEAAVSGAVSLAGTAMIKFIGGWDLMLRTLLVFMAADVLTGILASARRKSLDSEVMLWGGVGKVMVLLLVGIGAQLDALLSMQDPYIRTAVIWFYIGREGLSILENYGKFDDKNRLPAFLTGLLTQLQDKGDEGER